MRVVIVSIVILLSAAAFCQTGSIEIGFPGSVGSFGMPGYIEKQNLLTDPRDFSTDSWIVYESSQSASAEESPLGGTAQYWVGDASTGAHSIRQEGFTVAADNVLSVYAKNDGIAPRVVKVDMFITGVGHYSARWQWSGTEWAIDTVVGVQGYGVTDVGDGWGRFWIYVDGDVVGHIGTSCRYYIYLDFEDAGGSGNYIDGAQFEQVPGRTSVGPPYPFEQVGYSSWLPEGAMKWDDSYDFSANPAYYDTIADYNMYFDGQFGHMFDSSDFSNATLRALNSDMQVLAYTHPNAYFDAWASAAVGSFGRTFYDTMSVYVALDLDGDPWSQWPSNTMFNVADSNAVDAAVKVWKQYIKASPNVGSNVSFMFDYMTVPQVTYNSAEDDSLDLDQDGIWHNEDADEKQAMIDGYLYMCDQLAIEIPAIKLVPNGSLPRLYPLLTAKVHGIYIEGSGAHWASYNGKVQVAAMLDPDNPNNMQGMLDSVIPGGYFVMEENRFNATTDEDGSKYSLAIAMLFDNVYGIVQGESSDGEQHALPDWGDLHHWKTVGEPTGPYYQVTSPADSVGVYRRDFDYGSMRIGIRGTGSYPDPFFCQIWDQRGDLIDGF